MKGAAGMEEPSRRRESECGGLTVGTGPASGLFCRFVFC